MSTPAVLQPFDDDQRRQATDPARSFLVQAPAGSGKTELLIQRFLRLLAFVDRPEAIVAITFTRKAAGEMLGRVFTALRAAQDGVTVEKPYEQFTRDLAAAALAQDRERGWNLLDHPGRLRVQTIDSLCLAIAGEMPWLARLGALPRIEEDARLFYDEAARRAVLLIGDPEYRAPLETLLTHLDNDASRVQQLLSAMLATRDQWIELAVQTSDAERASIEAAMSCAIASAISAAHRLIPPDLRATFPAADEPERWPAMIESLLTKGNTWRKNSLLATRLAPVEGLLDPLKLIRVLPPARYRDDQWIVMRALLQSLTLALAQLRILFREEGTIDFCELGIAAREALGHAGEPTDLAFRLDARIEHLLVDEFQDTSRAQFQLLEKLTAGWQADDRRTLFLVGDPMQSIYRFRQAEVGLFLEARQNGIGDLRLDPLQLTSNYRSDGAIIAWVNEYFRQMFPATSDAATGAIAYSPSHPARPAAHESAVTLHAFVDGEDRLEAETVVRLIREARRTRPEGDVAILVRARTHLPRIVNALKSAGFRPRAVEIDPLSDRPVVQDLLALTRAMLRLDDRIAWLAILHAPWCGLALHDLEALVRNREEHTIWECLTDPTSLSVDACRRVTRLRETLAGAFRERGRWPLRRSIERAWVALGGPACLQNDESALQDAADFLDLLEREQSGSELPDLDAFRQRVTELFAQPSQRADEWLQVMTIHKAKGLEFDTVIVPGLGRPDRSDDKRLFLYHEGMLAPIEETGTGDDPLYSYLSAMKERKDRLERVRQFYVAATRARERLHLLGQVKIKKNGEPSPQGRSMLADLWPALSSAEKEKFHRLPLEPIEPAHGDSPAQPTLRVLSREWSPPAMPELVHWDGENAPAPQYHEPTFEWVGESLRRAGTVVHRFLEHSRADMPEPRAIRLALAHAGVSPSDLDSMAARVLQALERVQSSPRAQWILAARDGAQSEYAVTGILEGEIVRGTVDRTFVDEHGVRWIIDFKTSAHEGGALEEFLDEQQRRYRDQMERYARLLSQLGQPVRLGLYFPLLGGWREWSARPAVQLSFF